MKAPATTTATVTSAATASSPTRRSLRDWVADTSLFLVAALFGLGVIGGYLESSAPPIPG